MILTASRVFPSFRAHMANRRLMYTRMFVSRPATTLQQHCNDTATLSIGRFLKSDNDNGK